MRPRSRSRRPRDPLPPPVAPLRSPPLLLVLVLSALACCEEATSAPSSSGSGGKKRANRAKKPGKGVALGSTVLLRSLDKPGGCLAQTGQGLPIEVRPCDSAGADARWVVSRSSRKSTVSRNETISLKAAAALDGGNADICLEYLYDSDFGTWGCHEASSQLFTAQALTLSAKKGEESAQRFGTTVCSAFRGEVCLELLIVAEDPGATPAKSEKRRRRSTEGPSEGRGPTEKSKSRGRGSKGSVYDRMKKGPGSEGAEAAEATEATQRGNSGRGRLRQGFDLAPRDDTGFPFDKVFVINLDKRRDRWEHVQKELRKAGIDTDVERVPAVNGKKIDVRKLKKRKTKGGMPIISDYAFNSLTQKNKDELIFGHDLTPGALGCALSHIKIWHRIVKNRIGRALILEDDAHFGGRFKELVNARLSHVPEDWGVVYLSHINVKDGVFWHPDQGFVAPGVQFANADTRTTVGYLVNYKAAERLIHVTTPLSFQVDTHMTSFVTWLALNKPPGSHPPPGKPEPSKVEEAVVDPISYVLEPPLIVQLRNYGSDVQPKDMHSDGYEQYMLGRLKESNEANILPYDGGDSMRGSAEGEFSDWPSSPDRCRPHAKVDAVWEHDGKRYPGEVAGFESEGVVIAWDGEDTYSHVSMKEVFVRGTNVLLC